MDFGSIGEHLTDEFEVGVSRRVPLVTSAGVSLGLTRPDGGSHVRGITGLHESGCFVEARADDADLPAWYEEPLYIAEKRHHIVLRQVFQDMTEHHPSRALILELEIANIAHEVWTVLQTSLAVTVAMDVHIDPAGFTMRARAEVQAQEVMPLHEAQPLSSGGG